MANIQTLHDVGEDYQITPKIDGGIYGTGIADCVCAGIGDEFTLHYDVNALQVTFNTGSQAIIGGAYFKVLTPTSIQLDTNSTIYLCANIDITQPSGQTGSFQQRTDSNMCTDNLNGSNGTSRDLLLYIVTTSSVGITNVIDVRKIRGNGLSIDGMRFVALNSMADYEALSTAEKSDPYTWYIVDEEEV